MNKKYDIFISYSRSDLDKVKTIKAEIEQFSNAKCWMDLEGIESGVPSFTQSIIDGIEKCKVFLFMRSVKSQRSKYALLELNYASENKNTHVVIVNIDNSEMIKEFRFLYSLTDTIDWNDLPQHDKLLRDIKKWIGNEQLITIKSKIKKEALERLTLHLIEQDGKYGFVNEKGKTVIPCQWNKAWGFSDGLAHIKDANGKHGFIDKRGATFLPIKWKDAGNFSDGLAPVKDDTGKWGFIDKTGTVVIPCKWKAAGIFSEGLARVKDDFYRWGFVDKMGALVIPCQWNSASHFNEGLVRIKDANRKYGFIDKTGSIIITCKWSMAEAFNEGLAHVKASDGKWFVIDKTGKVVK